MIFEKATKPFVVKTKQHSEGVSVTDTEYRQYETLEEAATDAGGEDKLLDYINTSVKSDSLIGVRNYAFSIKDKEVDSSSIITKVRELRKAFGLGASATRVTKAEKVEIADNVSKFVNELPEGASISREELLKLMAAAKK